MNPLFAAPQALPAAHPGGISELAHVIVALLLVLGVVLVLARALRGARALSGDPSLAVLAQVSLGAKERAVLVRAGRTQLLVGVAPGQVSLLHVLPEPAEPPASATPVPAFASTFQALLRKGLHR
ncbi:MAG: flagellar biosynthetic protein FliO [Proteobacteria bacterium]|nr:flagellar biosynthetic protein FliO [Pseudomonadota bacterium]